MKKIIFLIGLLLSIYSFSLEEYKYEEVYVSKTPKNMKIIKMVNGKNEGLYGIVDNEKNLLTDTNNMLISIQENYIYLIDIDNNEGLISMDGQWIGKIGEYKYKDKHINMYGNYLRDNTEKYYFVVYKKFKGNNKFGVLDIKGDLLIPLKYDDARIFSDDIASVKKGNKWGYVDKKGEEIIPFKFDETFDFIDGKALVRIGKNRFYIDKDGNEKIFSTFLLTCEEWIERMKKHILSSFEEKMEKYQ